MINKPSYSKFLESRTKDSFPVFLKNMIVLHNIIVLLYYYITVNIICFVEKIIYIFEVVSVVLRVTLLKEIVQSRFLEKNMKYLKI